MANICSINIYIPLDEIPDEKEKSQLAALYEAEKKWKEAVKNDEELRIGKNYQDFIGSQPGVPFKKTEYKYESYDEEVKNGVAKNGELKPDSEQWNQPTIHASFEVIDDKIWVHPYGFGRSQGLLFDEENGITIPIRKYTSNTFLVGTYSRVPMSWEFKWSFPWWAEIGFAEGKKSYAEGVDAPKGQTDSFYDKWYEEHGQPYPYLAWTHSVSEIVKNLDFAIRVYENFPISGVTWQMAWVWKELNQLKDLYKWMKQVGLISSKAIAYLDWGEVAMNSGEYEWTQKNDSPNLIMASVKKMENDVRRLNEGKLLLDKFRRKYESHLRRNKKAYKGYVLIPKRDPFNYVDWL